MSIIARSLKIKVKWNKSYNICASIRKCSSAKIVNVSEEVKASCFESKPVVALETAVLTHGLPYPINIETVLDMESVIRSEGAIPATIGIIKGKIIVGMSQLEIEQLGHKSTESYKVSRRDFPYVLAKESNGGTTVCGTMVIANKVGIEIFSTGGIGGVHRGGETTMDISADLIELGRTPITVVSAGIKSILDIGKSLEYLETQGVCVAVVGPSKQFPGFFMARSGYEAPYNVELMEAAKLVMQKTQLGLKSGILFAVPIPLQHQDGGELIQTAIDVALAEAVDTVKGRDVTPFVLKRVQELSGYKSLIANIALLKNNAKVGAIIAKNYSKYHSGGRNFITEKNASSTRNRPIVIGGSIVDNVIKMNGSKIEEGRTFEGKDKLSCGGVGRNLAEALYKLECNPLFISAIGEDSNATIIMKKHAHMDNSGIFVSKTTPTPRCVAILKENGDYLMGVGDMDCHKKVTPQWVAKHENFIKEAPLVVLDGNMSTDTMQTTFELANKYNIPVWFEPTEKYLAVKPWQLNNIIEPSFASPNFIEMQSIVKYLSKDEHLIFPSIVTEDWLKNLIKLSENYFGELNGLMITMAENGFLMVCSSSYQLSSSFLENKFKIKDEAKGYLFTNEIKEPLVSASGGGDCLAAGFINAMLQRKTLIECASFGMQCAEASVKVVEAVPDSMPKLTDKLKPTKYTVITA